MAIAGVILLVVGGVVLAPTEPTDSQPARAAGHTDPERAAVVINADLLPHTQLPNLADVVAQPDAVAHTLRAAGLYVATDADGHCFAVTPRARLDQDPTQMAELPDAALAAVILNEATAAQMASRKTGYLPAGSLSARQRAAAQEIAKRQDLFDNIGQPAYPGAHLVVGIWRTWQVYVSPRINGELVSERIEHAGQPPSEPVVGEAPLGGSVLWWVWPRAEAAWAQRPITIEPGTYTLAQLADTLTRAGGLGIEAPEADGGRRLAVAARAMPAGTVLWAIEVALGGQVPVRSESEGDNAPPGHGLRPLWLSGYYTPSASTAGAAMFAWVKSAPGASDWVGWRLSQLPLLYRNPVQHGWNERRQGAGENPPMALDPDTTSVVWVQAAVVCPQLEFAEGGWIGPELTVPAL